MNESPRNLKAAEITEAQAESELSALLSDPAYNFLNEIDKNRDAIENADSSREALIFAKEKISARESTGVAFNNITLIEGVEMPEVSTEGFRRTIETVLKNAQQIGIGGDAFVVIDKNEIKNFPPEICYKFAVAEKTPRGRNPIAEEAELQGKFYELANNQPEGKIGVPIPFYSLEIDTKKLIAMEKLDALSVDDVLRGKGFLPDWLNVDELCAELRATLEHFHQNGLYHRDMHFGNIMISQKKELKNGDKMAFIIDFGLSGASNVEEYAYKKEIAGSTFTYSNDYGILEKVAEALKGYKSRQNRGI